MAVEKFSDVSDLISKMTEKEVGYLLGDREYDCDRILDWCKLINQALLQELSRDAFQPFKYVTHVIIVEKGVCGLHRTSAARINPEFDGTVDVKWSNKTMQCNVTIWGFRKVY